MRSVWSASRRTPQAMRWMWSASKRTPQAPRGERDYHSGMRKSLAVFVFLAASVTTFVTTAAQSKSFTVVEATIPEMQKAMKDGKVTSRQLVEQYLIRIALYNS